MDEKLLGSDERAVFALRSLYGSYGYRRFKMSRFEEYDLYVRNKDFLKSDEVITFTDHGGRLLAMKPDVTLSIIKNTADRPGGVEKLYYNENVYRVDSETHSFKEIMQVGLECVGDLGTYEIAETALLAVKTLAAVSDRFVLDISHMGLIRAVLDGSGLSDGGREKALQCLRQKNSHELLTLCAEEELDEKAAEKLTALTDWQESGEAGLAKLEALLTGEEERETCRQLRQVYTILKDSGYEKQVQVDLSLGNDLKYYSGVVFKGYIEGIPTAVLSGGQYDKLLRKMGRKSRAIGFALYTDLLKRLERGSAGYDVDTLLLADGGTDPAGLLTAAETLRRRGSVLVARELPRLRTWRRLARYENGEAVILEDNG